MKEENFNQMSNNFLLIKHIQLILKFQNVIKIDLYRKIKIMVLVQKQIFLLKTFETKRFFRYKQCSIIVILYRKKVKYLFWFLYI